MIQQRGSAQILETELKDDPTASTRVQLLVIRLGDEDKVDVLLDWTDAMSFSAPRILANGSTPLGSAVQLAMTKIEEQKNRYKAHGIAYKRPWLFVLTDGAPTDENWPSAADACKLAEQNGKFVFFGIGVGQANLNQLSRFSTRPPLRMQGLKFRELFVWLSRSATSASKASAGTSTQLTSPSSWAEIPT